VSRKIPAAPADRKATPVILFGACDRHNLGDLLTRDAWEAAVMLEPPEEAPAVIAQYDGWPERFGQARQFPGMEDRAPYCLGNSQSPQHGAVAFSGVGRVDLDGCDAVLRQEMLTRLRRAVWFRVRDRATLAHLRPDCFVRRVFAAAACTGASWRRFSAYR